MNKEAVEVVQSLFEYFKKNPDQLSISAKEKIKKDSLERVVCDYIAGMTDRFALNLYREKISISKGIV